MLPPSDLQAHLGFWLRYASNHVSQAFAVKLATKGVTVAEWVMLRALYDKSPLPPSRLAEELGMTRGAITKLADRLIGKALLTRTASPDDGRAQTLALTDQGRMLVPDLAAVADDNDAAFFAALSAEERQVLETLLKKIINHGQMTTIPID